MRGGYSTAMSDLKALDKQLLDRNLPFIGVLKPEIYA